MKSQKEIDTLTQLLSDICSRVMDDESISLLVEQGTAGSLRISLRSLTRNTEEWTASPYGTGLKGEELWCFDQIGTSDASNQESIIMTIDHRAIAGLLVL